MATIASNFDILIAKLQDIVNKLIDIHPNDNSSNNSDISNNHHYEHVSERRPVEQQWQQIQRILDLETLVDELRKIMTNTFVKEAKVR